MTDFNIRTFEQEDIPEIVETFTFSWTIPEDLQKKWEKFYQEQQNHLRTTYILLIDNDIIGYGSLLKSSDYGEFNTKGIPEIKDIWVLEKFRRKGYGEKLIKHLEKMAREEGYKVIGIAVGLYRDYGSAQRLYVKMGYIPDGNGVTYINHFVTPGGIYRTDDDLVLWLTKKLECP